jgi:hypothetical protein
MGRKFNGPAAKGRRRSEEEAATAIYNTCPRSRWRSRVVNAVHRFVPWKTFFDGSPVFVLDALHWIALAAGAPARTSEKNRVHA